MTVQVQVPTIHHTANGTTVVFGFNFRADHPSWVVQEWNGAIITTGVVQLNLDQQASPGGTVTFPTAPDNGATITIRRETEVSQELVYTTYTPFPAKSHEFALDKLTMLIQEMSTGSRPSAASQLLLSNVVDQGLSPMTMTFTKYGPHIALVDIPTQDEVGSIFMVNTRTASGVAHSFVMHSDGTMTVPTAPTEENQAARMKEVNDVGNLIGTSVNARVGGRLVCSGRFNLDTNTLDVSSGPITFASRVGVGLVAITIDATVPISAATAWGVTGNGYSAPEFTNTYLYYGVAGTTTTIQLSNIGASTNNFVDGIMSFQLFDLGAQAL